MNTTLLSSPKYFGQFGSIKKITFSSSITDPGNRSQATTTARVEYCSPQDADAAANALNRASLDNKPLKASKATVKMCPHFLTGHDCPNNDCIDMHSFPDSFNYSSPTSNRTSPHQYSSTNVPFQAESYQYSYQTPHEPQRNDNHSRHPDLMSMQRNPPFMTSFDTMQAPFNSISSPSTNHEPTQPQFHTTHQQQDIHSTSNIPVVANLLTRRSSVSSISLGSHHKVKDSGDDPPVTLQRTASDSSLHTLKQQLGYNTLEPSGSSTTPLPDSAMEYAPHHHPDLDSGSNSDSSIDENWLPSALPKQSRKKKSFEKPEDHSPTQYPSEPNSAIPFTSQNLPPQLPKSPQQFPFSLSQITTPSPTGFPLYPKNDSPSQHPEANFVSNSSVSPSLLPSHTPRSHSATSFSHKSSEHVELAPNHIESHKFHQPPQHQVFMRTPSKEANLKSSFHYSDQSTNPHHQKQSFSPSQPAFSPTPSTVSDSNTNGPASSDDDSTITFGLKERSLSVTPSSDSRRPTEQEQSLTLLSPPQPFNGDVTPPLSSMANHPSLRENSVLQNPSHNQFQYHPSGTSKAGSTINLGKLPLALYPFPTQYTPGSDAGGIIGIQPIPTQPHSAHHSSSSNSSMKDDEKDERILSPSLTSRPTQKTPPISAHSPKRSLIHKAPLQPILPNPQKDQGPLLDSPTAQRKGLGSYGDKPKNSPTINSQSASTQKPLLSLPITSSRYGAPKTHQGLSTSSTKTTPLLPLPNRPQPSPPLKSTSGITPPEKRAPLEEQKKTNETIDEERLERERAEAEAQRLLEQKLREEEEKKREEMRQREAEEEIRKEKERKKREQKERKLEKLAELEREKERERDRQKLAKIEKKRQKRHQKIQEKQAEKQAKKQNEPPHSATSQSLQSESSKTQHSEETSPTKLENVESETSTGPSQLLFQSRSTQPEFSLLARIEEANFVRGEPNFLQSDPLSTLNNEEFPSSEQSPVHLGKSSTNNIFTIANDPSTIRTHPNTDLNDPHWAEIMEKTRRAALRKIEQSKIRSQNDTAYDQTTATATQALDKSEPTQIVNNLMQMIKEHRSDHIIQESPLTGAMMDTGRLPTSVEMMTEDPTAHFRNEEVVALHDEEFEETIRRIEEMLEMQTRKSQGYYSTQKMDSATLADWMNSPELLTETPGDLSLEQQPSPSSVPEPKPLSRKARRQMQREQEDQKEKAKEIMNEAHQPHPNPHDIPTIPPPLPPTAPPNFTRSHSVEQSSKQHLSSNHPFPHGIISPTIQAPSVSPPPPPPPPQSKQAQKSDLPPPLKVSPKPEAKKDSKKKKNKKKGDSLDHLLRNLSTTETQSTEGYDPTDPQIAAMLTDVSFHFPDPSMTCIVMNSGVYSEEDSCIYPIAAPDEKQADVALRRLLLTKKEAGETEPNFSRAQAELDSIFTQPTYSPQNRLYTANHYLPNVSFGYGMTKLQYPLFEIEQQYMNEFMSTMWLSDGIEERQRDFNPDILSSINWGQSDPFSSPPAVFRLFHPTDTRLTPTSQRDGDQSQRRGRQSQNPMEGPQTPSEE
ncbi:hypothetical protein BLNAU_6581 [Blattamonas nauphoetae]|uniref:C3H1-type domain-containing protein n=1 Tax=Blattamonas nauphoetae TaxID=2049346 RepID=A0ABQ9Y469_9EUKA|nr:hypothetical protein BLNAU_6581 [Blattamonas nauphoetae]